MEPANKEEAFKQEQARVLEQLANMNKPGQADVDMTESKDIAPANSSLSEDEVLLEKARSFKEEGNQFFKSKEYKRAIGKYVRVHLFLKPVIDELTRKKDGKDKEDMAMAIT